MDVGVLVVRAVLVVTFLAFILYTRNRKFRKLVDGDACPLCGKPTTGNGRRQCPACGWQEF